MGIILAVVILAWTTWNIYAHAQAYKKTSGAVAVTMFVGVILGGIALAIGTLALLTPVGRAAADAAAQAWKDKASGKADA